uniref:thiamine-phosphate kinase n=1 Tax=Candidatus Scatousia sp. TaxID=3085663 RepID=UPI0040296A36
MKEKDFILQIQNFLNSEYIGDDCAYLKDLGFVITQDSMVEDIHFKTDFATPYQIGYKAAMVNISDVCASGAEPKYITVALSLPKQTEIEFVQEFYKGLKDACKDVEIVGGDITGSDKIYISITAIGITKDRKISSRKNAKIGQKIIVSGSHGSSGAGLAELLNGNRTGKFITKHLMPEAQLDFSRKIASTIKEDYAMMDTSDGLMDALSQIANESGVLLDVDFEKIPYDKEIENFKNYKNIILYGGEDYQLVATVTDPQDFTVIGEVKEGLGVKIGSKIYTKSDVEKNLYNHFEEKK